jgi:hypothetical protein
MSGPLKFYLFLGDVRRIGQPVLVTIIILFSLTFVTVPPSSSAQTPEPAPGSAQVTGPPADETAFSLGFHVGRGDAVHMEAARAAGGSFAVVVFSWANIEPAPGYLYWEVPDAALRAAEFYGIDLIARLDQPPTWALGPDDPSPWQLDAYAGFAQRVAARYGDRLAGVILWNEPNLSLEWNNQPPDAAAYTELLRAAYPAVKAVAPDLPVFMGGLASTEGEGDWAINDLDYLQALYAAGAGAFFDGLTAHPYGFGRPPDDSPEKYRPNFRRLELYREIMENNNDGHKPIWVTEMGWLTWTDDPRHDWQVVTPELQANYTLQAIDYAQTTYPWLERLGIWALNSGGDNYGYGIWQGPGELTPAYSALVESCPSRSAFCDTTLVNSANLHSDRRAPVTSLAPNVIIRLGDRGTLHPHWIHLYRGDSELSLGWRGEFFLTADQAGQRHDLLLETMQIDQPTNRLFINDVALSHLLARPRPDPTSTWVTQRFQVPDQLLRSGVNSISVVVGPRNPTRQYMGGRWENMQVRHIRLEPAEPLPAGQLTNWQPQPAPSGWSETNRLRPGLAEDFWLTGNRPGELWRGSLKGTHLLENQVANRPELVFNDILTTGQADLVATDSGLWWRSQAQAEWQPVIGAPVGLAYVVARAGERYYAGFEAEGLWLAASPSGPWQRSVLTATTVVDLTVVRDTAPDQPPPPDRLYATTEREIFVNNGPDSGWRQLSLPGLSAEELAEAGESPADKLKPRLYSFAKGKLVVRNQDRLWLQNEHRPAEWEPFGPERLYGKLYSVLNCCGPGTLVGTNDAGLWQLDPSGTWQRLDDTFFNTTDVTELLSVRNSLLAAGDIGLFQSGDGRTWQKMAGLPAVISDLVIDPADPSRWIAATPAGVFRSQDSGQAWASLSPPWTAWDLAFGPQGRLFVGRSNGLAWIDDLEASPIRWETAAGMEKVVFLRINPHPTEPQTVWAGTWGNNIAASDDGAQTIAPVHNGLETLSGLDLIWHPTPGQVTLATFEGLYRTDDGGQSWFKLPGPLARQTIYALLQGDDGAIWAGAADGLWLSRDYGVTWDLAEGMARATVLQLGKLKLPMSPAPPLQPPLAKQANGALVYAPREWLWAGTEGAGLWLSQDLGATWRFAGLPGHSVYNVFFDPLQSRRLVAATDRGIFAVSVPEEVLASLTHF